MSLAGTRLLVGVSGGVAAYKSAFLVRELLRRGAEVRVAMTASARRFVGEETFSGLTGHNPIHSLWEHPGEAHVELGAWADAAVIAPATMGLLGRLANGLADDVLTATVACCAGPIFLAPAMHHRMWEQAATQGNVAQLQQDGAVFIGPVEGLLANGETGIGRMAEPEHIADQVEQHLACSNDYAGKTVLVTAGATIEPLDPVRFLTNWSSGKMGYAVARAALARGARVVVVSGRTSLPAPAGAELVSVRSALEMHASVMSFKDQADMIVMAAAVSDYRPAQPAEHKLKKGSETLRLELTRNPDILSELGKARTAGHPVLVGFAVETHNLLEHARDKLKGKQVDMIVANEAAVAFGGLSNQATLVTGQKETPLASMDKQQLAHRILEEARLFLPSEP